MSNKDSLSTRMKEYYENRTKTYLTRKVPVIIRLDGRAFKNFTKGLKKPYDKIFRDSMSETMQYLCESVQGCKVGYTQSDEISLVLTDYDTLTTDAWFDYSVQKMSSISASIATRVFNKLFAEKTARYEKDVLNYDSWHKKDKEEKSEILAYIDTLYKKTWLAEFDSRCFNIPEEEVVNYMIWRQQDATRNAVQMLGQCNFPHKTLQGKTTDDVQDMLMTEKGINFNNMPTEFKRGSCCIKADENGERKKWVVDKEIPIFTKDREYIESCFQKAKEDD